MRWPEKWPFFFIIQLNRAEVWVFFFFFSYFFLEHLEFLLIWMEQSAEKDRHEQAYLCYVTGSTTIIYHTDTPIWCSLVIGTAAADVHRRLPVLFFQQPFDPPLRAVCVCSHRRKTTPTNCAQSKKNRFFNIFQNKNVRRKRLCRFSFIYSDCCCKSIKM